MEKLRESLKQSNLYRFAIYPVPKGTSQDSLPRDPYTTDLTIYVDDNIEGSDTKGVSGTELPKLRAIYNQRIFSSSRISFILIQLLQIIQNTAFDPEECVGKIDIMTEAQRILLPNPMNDLHW